MTDLRERLADRLLRGATTLGLECDEIRGNIARSGVPLPANDPTAGILALHEWLSERMFWLAGKLGRWSEPL
jgi:hypothetical protein